ncbi:Helix-turn-helix domain-containing protein [Azotobacter beijerinckii]|uniref:Helix-turn-helix domain-containing protein n=1 Tax=Azotobacter beijerinckii TaxID=170623 RepID=A0A1H9MRR9_9GAMM|nr:S24 family peptidase [Azotobacter beijerinckii]SER26179.1 Helix-turn-helix domain-containing protein [Azotobacter beijerinckii]
MSDLRKQIAKRLRMLRQAKEWTLEECARSLSNISSETITPSRYGNWEQGIRTPKLEQFVELGTLFGKPPAYIAGLTNNDGNAPEAGNYIIPKPTTISTRLGQLDLAQADDSLAISLELLASLGLDRNKVLLIRAIDSSMTGLIERGDRVLIDLSVSSVTRDDLFAILVGDRIQLRWIRQPVTGGYLVQAEDRNNYPDQSLSASELSNLTILGRAVIITQIR